jgi:Toxin co-regulated pilus biosynthesis protein Q.
MIKNRMRGLAAGIALAVSVGAFTQAHAERFEGFGQDIPLESAARQIVPGDVKVDFGAGVDPKVGITFSSAADWQSALSQAVSKKGLKAQIGKDQVTIVKAPKNDAARAYSSTPSKPNVQRKNNNRNNNRTNAPVETGPRVVADAPVTAPSSSHASAVSASPSVTTHGGGGFTIRQATVPAPSPAPVPASEAKAASATGHGMSGKEFASKDSWKPVGGDVNSGKFIVVPGYDLRVTLESWAAATGWTVNWQSEFKYQIEADATFQGDFVKATSDLIKAMSDARPTITVDFYSANRVVVISNTLADEVN